MAKNLRISLFSVDPVTGIYNNYEYKNLLVNL